MSTQTDANITTFMTPTEFFQEIQKRMNEIQRFVSSDMPRIAGKIAVDHFKESFVNQGFTDKNLSKWKPSKRTLYKDRFAASQYGTLLSSRKELMESITYRSGMGFAVIVSDKEYAQIHNEGGPVSINIGVTPKMRKFAWAKHFASDKESDEAAKWKGLALTKKNSIHISYVMPQRKFIGDSEMLNKTITDKVEERFNKILNIK